MLDFTPGAGTRGSPWHQQLHGQSLTWEVMNMISEARGLSTRHMYAQKWSIFPGWCSARNLDPFPCEIASCDLSIVLRTLCGPSVQAAHDIRPSASLAKERPSAGSSIGQVSWRSAGYFNGRFLP